MPDESLFGPELPPRAAVAFEQAPMEKAGCSEHHSQTSRRVRHKLQVDDRRLYRRLHHPGRQVVDGYTRS